MASQQFNPMQGRFASLVGGAGFNPLGAGDKMYGLGGRPAPNQGKAGASAKAGYSKRDAIRDAILKRQGAY